MKKLITFVLVIPAVCLLVIRLAAVIAGYTSVSTFAVAVGPLVIVAVLTLSMAVTSYILGLITGDLSWVDRMWSTVPVLYSWIYAQASGFDLRTTVAAALVTIWGARLTFNFARRGGYTTLEDYRWPILRGKIGNPVAWQGFSLLFISGYQNLMFLLFTLPVYTLYMFRGGSPGVAFWAGVVAFLLFLAYETTADQQQWQFQNAKAAHASGSPGDPELEARFGEDIRRGFRTSGLFRFSRHPNYFGELMVWWMIYQLATTAAGTALHWSGIGAVLLTLLFVGSTVFTESITRGRYPGYDSYRAETSAILPLPRRQGAGRSDTEEA